MLDQNTFMETVREVSEIIRTAPSPMTREEILSYFQDMELSSRQEEMVLEFLLTPHDDAAQDAGSTPGEDAAAETEQAKDSAEPDSKVFQMYREELAGLKDYSAAEMQAMYERLLAGDQAVIPSISDGWMRRVVDIVKELSDTAEGFEDAVQEGNLALFLKLGELCGNAAFAAADVETRLATAVSEAVKAAIVSAESEQEDEKSVVGKAALVGQAQKYLEKANGAKPTLRELADYTKLDEEELSDILALVRERETETKA